MLTEGDAGKTVAVRVGFTDEAGVGRHLRSDAYPSVGTVQPTMAACPAPALAGRTLVSDGNLTAVTLHDADNRITAFRGSVSDGARVPAACTSGGTRRSIEAVELVLDPVATACSSSVSPRRCPALPGPSFPCESAAGRTPGHTPLAIRPGHNEGWTAADLHWPTDCERVLYRSAENTGLALLDAETDRSSPVMTCDEALDPDSTPDRSAFEMPIGGGAGEAPFDVALSGSMTPRAQVRDVEPVPVSFPPPTANRFRDACGNHALRPVSEPLKNRTPGIDATRGALTLRDGDGAAIALTPGFSSVIGWYCTEVAFSVATVSPHRRSKGWRRTNRTLRWP